VKRLISSSAGLSVNMRSSGENGFPRIVAASIPDSSGLSQFVASVHCPWEVPTASIY